jgi:apolipoprotein N-acyltransferase
LVVLLGGLAAIGQAPFDLPIVAFIALILVFNLFRLTQTMRQAAWVGWVFGCGYFLISLHWIVEPFLVDAARDGWMAPFAILLISGGLALFWGAAFAVAHRIEASGRLSGWALVFSWTLFEMLRAYVFTGFPWAMPSYVLVNSMAGQAAAWVGPHGLNLILFGAACGVGALFRADGRRAWLGGLAFVVAAWAIFSGPEPQEIALDRPVARLIQPNAPQHQKWEPEHAAVFFARALEATRADAEVAPDVIIWPETAVPAFLENSELAVDSIAQAANGIAVVTGILRSDWPQFFNSAILIDQDGVVADIYDKSHLVPFGEYMPLGDFLADFGISGLAAREGHGYSAGAGARLMDLGAVGYALPLICYEAIFPQDVAATKTRPDVLMQLTNDAWFGSFSGPYQNLAQAQMRAIEQGLPMLRAANTGVSAMIDSHGVIRAAMAMDTDGYLDVVVPQPLAATPYSRSGDLPFALILLLVNAMLLGRALMKSD